MNLLRKVTLVILLTLAINCVAILAGVGYLFASGALNRERLLEIARLLFPDAKPTTAAITQAIDPATTQPLRRFRNILENTAGMSANAQVDYIRSAFDAQTARHEQQRRDLVMLKGQLDAVREQLGRDRAELEARERSISDRETQFSTKVVDEGFKDSLALYNQLPTRQVKQIFAKLDDQTVVRYLQAMDARRASRIISEFKSPEDLVRAQALLERMRRNDASQEAAGASVASPR